MSILAGRFRQGRSSVCGRYLQATRRGNLEIIGTIYRNLVLLRRKSSALLRRIVSDLASPK